MREEEQLALSLYIVPTSGRSCGGVRNPNGYSTLMSGICIEEEEEEKRSLVL